MNYQVSVIVPVYKVEKYIEKCARSLFEQTLSSIEFIFVDDCSPDNSIAILKSVLNEYPSRISDTRIVRHEYNRGLAAARNTGRSIAQGEYLISCDSDDWVDQNMYELMYQKAQQTKSEIVICDWEEVYISKTLRQFINPPVNNIECVVALLSGKMHGSVVNKLIKKTLYTEHNIMCKEGMDFCEDFYVTYRLFYFARTIAYINLPLYYYNKSNLNSYTSTKLSESSQKGLILLLNDIRKFFNEQQDGHIEIKKAILYFVNNIKSSILFYGSFSYARKLERTGIDSILCHPTLRIHSKIALIFCNMNFWSGIKLIRYIYHNTAGHLVPADFQLFII